MTTLGWPNLSTNMPPIIATATALYLTGFPVGFALALVSLGHLATAEAWRIAFFVAAALAFAALVLFATTYRPAKTADNGPQSGTKLSK